MTAMALESLKENWNTKKTISVIAVVVILSAALYVVYDFNGKSLDFSDTQSRLVVTGSMEGDDQPFAIKTIKTNSLIMIHNLSADEAFDKVHLGDVLAFKQGNMIIVHRVIAIDPVAKTFTTRGDHYVQGINGGLNTVEANGTANSDSPVTADKVVGVVVGCSEWMGAIINFAKGSTMILVMFIIVAIIAVTAVVEIVRVCREK